MANNLRQGDNVPAEVIRNFWDRRMFSSMVTTAFLEEVLRDLDTNPVNLRCNEISLENPPKYHAGLVICRSCRDLYFVTMQSYACGKVIGNGIEKEGPFCGRCIYTVLEDVSIESKPIDLTEEDLD